MSLGEVVRRTDLNPATTRNLRLHARPRASLALSGSVFGFMFVALFVLSVIGGAPLFASGDWTEVGRASFDGGCDAKSISADVGTITTSTASGRSLKDVAGGASVTDKSLLLADAGALTRENYGVRLSTTRDLAAGALIAFNVRPESDSGTLVIDLTDEAQADFNSGDVSEGGQVDACSMTIDDGKVTLGGTVLKTKLAKGNLYHFEIVVVRDVAGDWLDVTVTNNGTGEYEHLQLSATSLPKTLRGIDFTKKSGKTGAFTIDELALYAPAK